MTTFTIRNVMEVADRTQQRSQKSATIMLEEAVRMQVPDRQYDIFLSHSSKDAKLILGIIEVLKNYRLSVYVDWIVDPQLDRSNVTPSTAKTLRCRMDCCNSLFYATTQGSVNSRWMPWECGYIDGKKGRSAILPVTETETKIYKGQEYLGIYPYITWEIKNNCKILQINESHDIYCTLDEWFNGLKPYRH